MAHGPAEHDAQLDVAIADFLRAEEAGEHPDPGSWVRRFPALADDLWAFFDDRALVGQRIAAALPASGMRYGPYRILRLLGRGGMGLVLEAHDERDDSGRIVALKALPACGMAEPSHLERFFREVDVTRRLVHPNIVPLLDAGTHEGIPYYVMVAIDGPDLREVLHRLRRSRRDGTPPDETYLVALPDSPHDPEPLNGARPPWRAICRIGLQAARALAYAHERGILHRDVKPSNLLLDRRGVVYLTDFGLARTEAHTDLTRTDELAGALRFVAPERFHRWCDPRSDIYSLGLTLYELLTLRPAFEAPSRAQLIQAVLTGSPKRPRSIDRTIPRALEAIVLKAMEKDPGYRYPSAQDMAADLERFLDGRPVQARRVGLVRRAWSWSRRNKLRAVGIASLLLATAGLVVGAFRYERMRGDKARIERDMARAESHASRYQALLVQLQQARSRPRYSGWSDRAWRIVELAAALRRDAALRDQAAAVLVGPDARRAWSIEGVGHGATVAFAPDGRRLLVGGQVPGSASDGCARLLDAETGGVIQVSRQVGPGPVAFGLRGEPLQLVSRTSGGSLLWDVSRQAEVARFDSRTAQPARALALAAGGQRVAASGGGGVRVWDVYRPEEPLRAIPAESSALAFTPDARLLALGDELGRILVVDLSGESEPGVLSRGRSNTIKSLAFGPDPGRGPEGTSRWRLASGDSGSEVTIWDVTARHPTANCRGSLYDVTALAFSPDGGRLLSGGRYEAHLWDAATGEELLRIGPADHVGGIAFDTKHPRAAIGSRTWGDPGRLTLWEIEEDRGIRTMRGLSAPIARVIFSKDGRRVAALSQGWRAAAWDVDLGRLLAVVAGPPGFSADNAGLAFSPDHRRLALAAGRESQVWDLDTGRLRTRSLPAGLCDALAWDDTGRLLLARSEKREDLGRFTDDDWRGNPRVVRLRDLNAPEADRPLLTLTEGNRETLSVALDADGRRLTTSHLDDGPDGPRRVLTVTDISSRRECWRVRRDANEAGALANLAIDPAGKWVRLALDGPGERNSLVDAVTGRLVGTTRWAGFPSPTAGVLASFAPGPTHRAPRGCTLFRDFDRPCVTIGLDERIPVDVGISFSYDGRLLGFGTTDGSVLVCDLEAVRERLSRVGLGW